MKVRTCPGPLVMSQFPEHHICSFRDSPPSQGCPPPPLSSLVHLPCYVKHYDLYDLQCLQVWKNSNKVIQFWRRMCWLWEICFFFWVWVCSPVQFFEGTGVATEPSWCKPFSMRWFKTIFFLSYWRRQVQVPFLTVAGMSLCVSWLDRYEAEGFNSNGQLGLVTTDLLSITLNMKYSVGLGWCLFLTG